jgi:hypothetical protein
MMERIHSSADGTKKGYHNHYNKENNNMSISQKKAKRILKRAIKVGVRECAFEEGKSEATIERYCRLAKAPPAQARATVDSMYRENHVWTGPTSDDANDAKERTDLIAAYTSQDVSVKQPSDNRPIMVVPDLHAPYHHPEAIEFLAWVQENRGCRPRIASVGDMWDFHAMSFHQSEPESTGIEAEYQAIRDFSEEFTSVFPEGDIVLGNHCDIPSRKMKEAGLTPTMLGDLNRLYNMPKSWDIHNLYYVLEPDTWNVLVEHGCGSGGKYGCANTSKEKRCSYVQGHTHSNAAVIYSQNYKDTTFAMNVGCLIDSSSYAFKYAKHTTRKGNEGCGVIYGGGHAEFVPMETWRNYKVWF